MKFYIKRAIIAFAPLLLALGLTVFKAASGNWHDDCNYANYFYAHDIGCN